MHLNSAVFITPNGDDSLGADAGQPHNKWPDPDDQHGVAGATFGFCDGHAQFVALKRFLDVWNLGQDLNRTPP